MPTAPLVKCVPMANVWERKAVARTCATAWKVRSVKTISAYPKVHLALQTVIASVAKFAKTAVVEQVMAVAAVITTVPSDKAAAMANV